MANVSLDDVQELWTALSDRSWDGLIRTVRARLDMAGDVDDAMLNQVMRAAQNSRGEQFPSSAQVLHDVINMSA